MDNHLSMCFTPQKAGFSIYSEDENYIFINLPFETSERLEPLNLNLLHYSSKYLLVLMGQDWRFLFDCFFAFADNYCPVL